MLLRLVTLGALGYGAYRSYKTWEENERRDRVADVSLAGGPLSGEATLVRPSDDPLTDWPEATVPPS
jgi:hypothetical protein